MEMQPVDVFIGQMKNIFLLVCGIVGKTQQSSHLFSFFVFFDQKIKITSYTGLQVSESPAEMLNS